MNNLEGIVRTVFLLGLFLGTQVQADEFRPLFRGARAQAMGNAFTAVADDEEAIFYNPAGLAGIRQFSIHLASVNAEVSNDLIDSLPVLTRSLSNPGISSVNNLMGKDISLRGQGFAAIMIPKFAIAGIFDEQAAIRIKNASLPTGLLGAQSTYGAQIGFGTTLAKLKKKKGEFRVGLAAKVLWRGGGYQPLTLSQLLTLDTGTITTAWSNPGLGIGADFGTQFIYQMKKGFSLMAGLAFTDIGDTAFNAPNANPQKSNLVVGIAARVQNSGFTGTLSYDYAHILEYTDWRKKIHLGLELKFPLLSLSCGLSQMNFTYGAALDFGLIQVRYASYAEELGTLAGQDTERRQVLNVSVKFSL